MKKAMKIKVINRSAYALPQYETAGAAGMDVRADIRESIVLGPLERTLVPTGLYVEIPDGYEIQVRPRSGLAARHGISLANSPGTIDPDYRGEIKAILVNLSDEPFEIKPGERIAQLVVARFERAEWESVETLGETARGEGGMGSDEGDPAPDYEEIARRGSNGLRLSLFLGRHAQNRPGSSGKYDKKTTAGKGQLGSIV